MKLALLSTVLLFLVGCGSSPIVPYPHNSSNDLNSIDYPPSGKVINKGIGEVVAKKGKIELLDALNISKQTKFNKADGDSSIMTCALTIEPQTIFLRGQYKTKSTQAECYGTVNTRRTLADGGTNFNCPGAPLITADICKESNGTIFMAFLSSKAPLKQDFDNLQFVKAASSSKDNYVQELVYNGLDGNKVKFVYKEYSGDSGKPDYFQEFTSSIFKSKDIVFKNVRLRILEATEDSIEYRLEQNF